MPAAKTAASSNKTAESTGATGRIGVPATKFFDFDAGKVSK